MDGGHELPDMTSTHLISSEREEEGERRGKVRKGKWESAEFNKTPTPTETP